VSAPGDTPTEKGSLELTCIACRLRQCDSCTGVIVVATGKWTGVYKCACFRPHKRGNGILILPEG
jgi:hypothetical protein